MAMKLFGSTQLCFEFQASNRIKEPKLRALMTYIRTPTRKVPPEVAAHWASIQLQRDDTRLTGQRFQIGHMIGIYWSTVARWMTMRARRDAVALRTPLFHVQAADDSRPAMPAADAKKRLAELKSLQPRLEAASTSGGLAVGHQQEEQGQEDRQEGAQKRQAPIRHGQEAQKEERGQDFFCIVYSEIKKKSTQKFS